LKFYGSKLIPTSIADPPEVPLVMLANKRDLEDIVELSKIRQVLDTAKLSHCLVYETIAITGVNVKRAFVYGARQAVLNHYKKLSGQAMESPSW
jgi:signal recognition particle receptor subunit beta